MTGKERKNEGERERENERKKRKTRGKKKEGRTDRDRKAPPNMVSKSFPAQGHYQSISLQMWFLRTMGISHVVRD